MIFGLENQNAKIFMFDSQSKSMLIRKIWSRLLGSFVYTGKNIVKGYKMDSLSCLVKDPDWVRTFDFGFTFGMICLKSRIDCSYERIYGNQC